MAATTLADFYLPFVNPDADEATRMRVSTPRHRSPGASSSSASRWRRSSWPARCSTPACRCSPSALGRSSARFLLGTLSRSMREQDVFAGMVAGLLVMAVVWWATPVAFTWYVLIGATTTVVVASLSLAMTPRAAARRRRGDAPFERTRAVLRRGGRPARFPWRGRGSRPLRRRRSDRRVGTLSYDAASTGASESTIYDLASLTKVALQATLAASLAERGVIALDDPVRRWSRAWQGEDRRAVTLRHLLLHASGLPAHRRYFESLAGRAGVRRGYRPRGPGVSRRAHRACIPIRDSSSSAASSSVRRRAPLDSNSRPGASRSRWRRREHPFPPARSHGSLALAPTEARRLARTPGPWRSPRRERRGAGRRRRPRGAVRHGRRGRELRAVVDVAGDTCHHGRPSSRGARSRTARARSDGTPCSPTSSCGTRMSTTPWATPASPARRCGSIRAQDYYVVLLSNRVHPLRERATRSARVRRAVHDAVAEDLTRG